MLTFAGQSFHLAAAFSPCDQFSDAGSCKTGKKLFFRSSML